MKLNLSRWQKISIDVLLLGGFLAVFLAVFPGSTRSPAFVSIVLMFAHLYRNRSRIKRLASSVSG